MRNATAEEVESCNSALAKGDDSYAPPRRVMFTFEHWHNDTLLKKFQAHKLKSWWETHEVHDNKHFNFYELEGDGFFSQGMRVVAVAPNPPVIQARKVYRRPSGNMTKQRVDEFFVSPNCYPGVMFQLYEDPRLYTFCGYKVLNRTKYEVACVTRIDGKSVYKYLQLDTSQIVINIMREKQRRQVKDDSTWNIQKLCYSEVIVDLRDIVLIDACYPATPHGRPRFDIIVADGRTIGAFDTTKTSFSGVHGRSVNRAQLLDAFRLYRADPDDVRLFMDGELTISGTLAEVHPFLKRWYADKLRNSPIF